MKEGWRWFGPLDSISLAQIAQAGASDVVTALHEFPFGEVWTEEAIRVRKDLIAKSNLGLQWSVVESLQVPDAIKRGEGDISRLFASYRQSLANLAKAGIRTVCYNFSPLLGWTRTDLESPIRGGATAVRFSEVKMAAFEIFMLKRTDANRDYSTSVCDAAEEWFQSSTEDDRATLLKSIMNGLPGAFKRYDVESLREVLKQWEGFGAEDLRSAFARFLFEVVPTADDLGIRLCAHPDDPPRSLLGLPRIVSTAADLDWIAGQQPSLANGFNFCTGALGAKEENDIPAIYQRHAERVHFLHLRSVQIDRDGSFQEDVHLKGRSKVVEVVSLALDEEQRRRESGRSDWEIVFRPDHGQSIGPDLVDATHHPGYPYVGRLRGLAELRGVIAGLSMEK